MRLLDPALRGNLRYYVFQCSLATVATLIILAVFSSISNGFIVAALGGSTFIVFVLPQARSSRARYLIGGYVGGLLTGMAGYWLGSVTDLPMRFGLVTNLPHVVFGALAVGLAIFLMVVTDTEHPPAAAVSLGIVMLQRWSWVTVAAVLAGIIMLCLVKRALKPILHDLL